MTGTKPDRRSADIPVGLIGAAPDGAWATVMRASYGEVAPTALLFTNASVAAMEDAIDYNAHPAR